MDRNRVEGKVKDVAGRIERQAGEWTGNTRMQIQGAAKQAEGKVQNAVGQIKDAGKAAARSAAEEETQEVPVARDDHRR